MPLPLDFATQIVPRVNSISLVGPAQLIAVTHTNDTTAVSARADLLVEPGAGLTKVFGHAPESGADLHSGIISMSDAAGVLLHFATGGADNATASFAIWLWRCFVAVKGGATVVSGSTRSEIAQWHPVQVGVVQATACTRTGLAGGLVLDTERYVDTISITTNRGYAGQLATVPDTSPADNGDMCLKVDAMGAPFLSVQRTASSGASDVWKVFAQKITVQ